MGGKRKGYKAPKTRVIMGFTFRLEQSTKRRTRAEKIKSRLINQKWSVRVLPAPESSRYNWEIYKRRI